MIKYKVREWGDMQDVYAWKIVVNLEVSTCCSLLVVKKIPSKKFDGNNKNITVNDK